MRDLGITQALAPGVPEAAVPLLVVLTALGGPKLVAAASVIGPSVGIWAERVELDRARQFLVGVGLALSASVFLKHGLALPRPPMSLMAIPEDGFGFPSGHATAAAGVVTAFLGSSSRVERWQYAVAVAYVSLIGATRVLLGVHYLLDVLAGVVVGVGVATLGLRATRARPVAAQLLTLGVAGTALVVWAVA